MTSRSDPAGPNVTTIDARAAERESGEQAVAQFLARGGKVQRLPHGATSIPVAPSRAEANKRNWRRREAGWA